MKRVYRVVFAGDAEEPSVVGYAEAETPQDAVAQCRALGAGPEHYTVLEFEPGTRLPDYLRGTLIPYADDDWRKFLRGGAS